MKQQSVGAVEAVPEWTEQAQKSLQAASESALGGTAHLTIVPLPALTPEENATLREHLELFKVIGSQLEIVQVGGAAWKAARESADYRIGPGLRFLRERTGARYAFLLTGAQVRQSGGTVLMQLAFAGVGVGIATATGTYTYAGIVDLDSGQLSWAASNSSTQQFGIGGGDTRTPEGAGKLVEKLFTGYPRSTLASFRAAAVSSARAAVALFAVAALLLAAPARPLTPEQQRRGSRSIRSSSRRCWPSPESCSTTRRCRPTCRACSSNCSRTSRASSACTCCAMRASMPSPSRRGASTSTPARCCACRTRRSSPASSGTKARTTRAITCSAAR
ncbi:MAG: hypothetical protein U1F11_07845 [Steroidobacteraceae bacterium]